MSISLSKSEHFPVFLLEICKDLRSEVAMRKVFGIKIKKFADTLLFLIVQLTFGPNSTDCRSKLPCNSSNSQIFPAPMCQHLYWCEYSPILFSGLPKHHNRTEVCFGTRQVNKWVYPTYINTRLLHQRYSTDTPKQWKQRSKPTLGKG